MTPTNPPNGGRNRAANVAINLLLAVLLLAWFSFSGQWHFGTDRPWQITIDSFGTYIGTGEDQWIFLNYTVTLLVKFLVAVGPVWALQRYRSRRAKTAARP